MLSYNIRKRVVHTIVNMNFVSNTNTFLAVVLEAPEKEDIIRLTSKTDAGAPEVLPFEFVNALTAIVKRKALTSDEAVSAYDAVSSIPVRLVSVDIRQALRLAFEFNIFNYVCTVQISFLLP